MPDQDALHQEGIVCVVGAVECVGAVGEDRLRTLPHHLRDGGRSILEIVRGTCVAGREGGRDIFQIREPDVHQAFQRLYSFHALIAPCIVDDWNAQPIFLSALEGRDQERHEMLGSYEIDVVRPLLLEFKKDLRQSLRRELDQVWKEPAFRAFRACTCLLPARAGDPPVLAVNTAQIAACEKYRAASPPA